MANIGWNKEKADRILHFIRRGVHPAQAARAVGIHPRTLRNWVKTGKDEEERRAKYATGKMRDIVPALMVDDESDAHLDAARRADQKMLFAMEFDAAEAEAEADLVEHIREVAANVSRKMTQPDAKPAQWLLSRRFRERWGDKMALDVETVDGGKKMDLSKLSDEQLAAFEAMLEIVTVGGEEEDGDDSES
jgi:transposase-like protein